MIQITQQIESWMDNRANNALEPGAPLPAFGKPLVGVAHGEDALFTFLKHDIGPDFYWTPEEAFLSAFPEEQTRADELSVIAWVLPQTEHTRLAQRKSLDLPSIEWSKARHYGEMVNENLRRYLVDLLEAEGYRACAPVLLPQWSRALSGRYGFASSWSERHAAHACGLGTFGISDGLITPVGKAVRVGSVVVRRRFTATPRLYAKHNEWCLFHATGKCLVCMRRCPAGAISQRGHDKVKCKQYIRSVTAVHVEKEQLGIRVSSCGLCQTKVPCENRIPLAMR
ncbi:4Fe-4S ferredoxin [Desulfopila sp. IMCC35006]|uniref:4Fe-4S ferredoxin n=1 Tax=Desulfopila sp. IMCC35006 TaxID=2569542 RepID=UPI0010AC2FA6|nr:4Fe-4S ferredoxin [Desulfopila sp. IMCC35006]TKB28575.1 4Fe-4S ferredoxin [Desulfopila sp. IMCC35006]